MALRTLVKISSVNNLSDARYAAGMGVDLLGFDLDHNSENYVTPEEFAAMTSWISGVQFVGEVGPMTKDRLLDIQQNYQLDYLQVADTASLELDETLIPIIFKLTEPDPYMLKQVLDKHSQSIRWVLLETESELLEIPGWCIEMNTQVPMIIGTGVHQQTVSKIIEQGFAGVALKGGNEVKPGYRNFDEMADILEELEIED